MKAFDKTIHLPVAPDEAFALLTEPALLRRWQSIVARVDLRIGGEYRWTVTPGHHAAGTFTEIEPGVRVVFTWGWESGMEPAQGASIVGITLKPDRAGTLLRLVHEGLEDSQAAAHAVGWEHYLERLQKEASSPAGAGPDGWAVVPDPVNHLGAADAGLAVLLGVLREITAEDLDKPTPCEKFDVQELLDHIAGSLLRLGAGLGVDPADESGAEAEERIANLAQPLLEALARRGMEGKIDMGFAELPATTVAGIVNLELLVHAWDFATALGRTLEVTDVLGDYVRGLAEGTITDRIRAGGAFGAVQPKAEKATGLERLVAFTGRTVHG